MYQLYSVYKIIQLINVCKLMFKVLVAKYTHLFVQILYMYIIF